MLSPKKLFMMEKILFFHLNFYFLLLKQIPALHENIHVLCTITMYYVLCIYHNTHTHFKGFFEVAIESWPDRDLNSQPLNSVQML